MMIMLHVIIALMSLVVSVLGLATASRRLVAYAYGLIAATVATGCALLLIEPDQMLHVCVSGLLYVALSTSLTLLAQRRAQQLTQQTNK
jgi:hypothetical protein